MRTLLLTLLLFTGTAASAQTMTASCKDPSGRALGILGELGGNKQVDGPDSMQGGVITVSWRAGQSKASIVVSTGAASSVSSTEGHLVFRTEDQLTFFAHFPGAAYMVSLFPNPKRLLVSSHQQFLGMDPGSAVAKTFQARCDISLQ